MKKNPEVDAYIAQFGAVEQAMMQELRATIFEAVPDAKEIISYKMPAYKLGKTLVYFAANKKHIGFYPTPGPVIAFAEELKSYGQTKAAIHFPIGKPMPLDLVKRIVLYRVGEKK